MEPEKLITDYLDLWTTAIKRKSTAGRGSSSKVELYGIKKLRDLILELAVRGLLVPQDPNEETTSELLKKVTAEKAKLVKEGKIKMQKPLSPIIEKEKLFSVPESWEWVRIANLGYDFGQKTPDTNFTYIDVGAIDNRLGLIDSPTILRADEAPSRARKIVKNGTVIYSTVRPYLLNIAIVQKDFEPEPIASTAFAVIHPFKGVSCDYIYRYLRSPSFVSYVESVQTGIAYPAINDKQFFSGLLPLPPTAEQHRIVAKVDELMTLCDQLEQQTDASLSAHQTLVETLLNALTSAADHTQFACAWRRIAEHFDTLFTTEKSVDQLKQTILQLAVMGKLVPQDPNDEPTSKLLKTIAAEKAKLLQEGKIKKELPLRSVSYEELPFKPPQSWGIARLGEVIKISSGDGLTSAQMSPNGDIPVYGGNGVNGYHDQANVDKPTLVIGRVGFYCGSIHITPSSAWVTDNAFITSFHERIFIIEYLALLLKGTNLKENENATAQPVISGRKVYPIPICFPSVEEQKRIVAKVDELMLLCGQLKSRLSNAQTIQLHMSDALTDKALARA